MTQQQKPCLLVWARALGLALALLLPQLLTLLHGVGHPHTPGLVRTDVAHGSPDSSALGELFAAHEEGSSDCRLYDQASHDGFAIAVIAFDPPPHHPGTGVALFAGDAIARWSAQFDARGPPLTS